DPSEAEPVMSALEKQSGQLVAILNTHHHWDHTGGNKALLEKWPELAVYGHVSDRGRIPGQTEFPADGDTFWLGKEQGVVRHIPGHTTGAVAYCFEEDVFTGDTLFYGGCGRLFEGTPAMMFRSLTQRLAGELDGTTRVWCGHEYTVQNLHFALHSEPDNQAIRSKLNWAENERRAGRATVPSTLNDELAVNPFVRAKTVAELAELRSQKDNFRG
ncbi:MAG TPA: hydroxyacylglutathione hydrolase, partial [Myxococcales bacterium]|nr:hydroxyacylglutathione hydrolase [Myxococcales bacterium]